MWRLRIGIHTRADRIPDTERLRPGRSILYSWLYRVDPVTAAAVHADTGRAPFGYGPPTFPGPHRPAGRHGWWDIGTSDARLARAWMTILATKPLINWGGVAVTVTSVHRALPPPLHRGVMAVRTDSPVVLRTPARDGNTPILPGDRRYIPTLRASLRTRARAAGIPIGRDPQVHVTQSGPLQQVLVSGSGEPRIGCTVVARITAPPRLLEALWCLGIGSQTGAGCGWIHDPDAPTSLDGPPC